MELTFAIKRTFFHILGFAFVDDNDTVQTGDLDDKTSKVVKKAQQELNLWEELVRTTGGGLEGDKSDFAIINYEWKSGIWKYKKPHNDTCLTVCKDGGTRQALTQLRPSEARRTLGVWQAIDGNEAKQTEKLKAKALKWSRAVTCSSLT